MRKVVSVLVLPLAWYAIGCAGGEAVDDRAADSGRDLTTLNSDIPGEAVVSQLELGRTDAPPEARFAVSAEAVPETSGSAESSETEIAAPAPAVVSFTDGIDLASEPQVIEASLPIMGAGSGTLLRPGVTVATGGNPIDLFRPTKAGDSPWPEARTGEFPTVGRNEDWLAVGQGGHGACPAPGALF